MRKENNMKKYGIYYTHSGSTNKAFLTRECSTLKEAVIEAFRLSRWRYRRCSSFFTDMFIVGDNTGIALNTSIGHVYITYYVEREKLFDKISSRITAIAEHKVDKSVCIVKEGIL